MEPGASIYTFQASDQDGSGPNSLLTYSILHQYSDLPDLLALDPSTGVLTLAQELDHEVTSSLILVIQATDSALNVSQRRWGSVTARVFVTDENDNAPVFSSSSAVSVMEDQPVGFVVLYVVAQDADQGENRRVSYFIETGNAGGTFSLNRNTGSLSILKPIDREEQDLFNLTIVAQDHGVPALSSSQLLSVQVIDVNDEVPWFQENQEAQEQYTLTVYARDGGVPPNFARASVKIRVLDENDNAPAFSRLYYSLEVPENMEPVELFTLRATDLDTGDSGEMTYKITEGDPSGDFRVDRKSGVLSTSRPLDRERRARYSLTVTALDGGSPALSSTATIEVTLLDINDHSPQFTSPSYTADLSEDVPIGSLVQYFLSRGSQGMFIIDQHTGHVITAAPLDRERTASYTFDVCATDSSPTSPRNSTATVTVYVQDVNDNAPFFIQDPLVINISASSVSSHRVLATMRAEDRDFGANGSVFYRFASPGQRTLIVEAMDQGSPAQSSLGVVVIYIREQTYRGIHFSRHARDVSLQENAAKGTAVVQTQAQYPDGSRSGISYSIFSGNTLHSFGISSSTGEIWVQSSMGLDYEETPRLRLVVKAETASSSSFMAVNLILQDVVADDLDQGQNGQVTYSLRSSSLSGLFKIDPLTGSITTAAIMDREIWTQTKLVVTATDRGTPRLAGSATLTE
ncbi:unnamed protein product [Coregonus sp. 'balchen']|nr:unnamed protein product [Coregonus sp. 'balchen']